MTATSAEQIATMATELLGAQPVTDLDNSPLTGVSRMSYEMEVRRLLELHHWRFSRKLIQLDEDASAAPVAQYARAFIMPAPEGIGGRVGLPRSVFRDSGQHQLTFKDWKLSGEHLLTNETALWAWFVVRKTERDWPAAFQDLVVHALAAKWAMPITEVQEKRNTYYNIAFGNAEDQFRGGLFAAARHADIKDEPAGSVLDGGDPLSSARFATAGVVIG